MLKEIALGLASLSMGLSPKMANASLPEEAPQPTSKILTTIDVPFEVYEGEFGFIDIGIDVVNNVSTFASYTSFNSYWWGNFGEGKDVVKRYLNWDVQRPSSIPSPGKWRDGLSDWYSVSSLLNGSSFSTPLNPSFSYMWGGDWGDVKDQGIRLAYWPVLGEDGRFSVQIALMSSYGFYYYYGTCKARFSINDFAFTYSQVDGDRETQSNAAGLTFNTLGRLNYPSNFYITSTPQPYLRGNYSLNVQENDGRECIIGNVFAGLDIYQEETAPFENRVGYASGYAVLGYNTGTDQYYDFPASYPFGNATFLDGTLTLTISQVDTEGAGGTSSSDAYQTGYQTGYNQGYSDGSQGESSAGNTAFNMIKGALNSITGVAGIQLFPGITLGTLIILPVAGALLVWLLKLLRG